MQESANQDYFGYYKCIEVANLYLDLKNKYLERIFVLRYEKAIYDPVAIYIRKIFYFVDIPFENKTKNYLQTSIRKAITQFIKTRV